jgi:hypothetical protein
MSRKAICFALTVLFLVAGWPWAAAASPDQQAKGEDRILSKITFIHYHKGNAKPPWAGSGKPDSKDDGSYSYIAKGAKWKFIEDIWLNPYCSENPDGAMTSLIVDAVSASLDEWETPRDTVLRIFGSVSLNDTVTYNDGVLRGYNTISFGYYQNPNVIAVTTVWGYFTGPPAQREIVETHILMNDDFVWGDALSSSAVMDVQNIATHEIGHCAGMGDLYEANALEETMYGYSSEGETKKRDLYKGDISGITKLYQ